MGLKDTLYISPRLRFIRKIRTSFTSAHLGHAFGPNEERGVFMTTDGGKTWTKTLYIDREHGVSDLDIDPTNPNILYAGMWSFERKPWTHRSGSEKGGLYKSIDGGRTWNKLTNGLPKLLGRIGVRMAPSNPNVVYAIVESKDGTLYRSDDRGETFKQVSKQTNIVSRGFYYTTVRVDPTNENHVYAVASNLYESIDGGKTFQVDNRPGPHRLPRVLAGSEKSETHLGGTGRRRSYELRRRRIWETVNNMPLGPVLPDSCGQPSAVLLHHGRIAG